MYLVARLIVIAVASGVSAQGPAPSANNAAPPGNAANGKKIYDAYGCYQCHGFEGQGGGGARLAPAPRLWFPAWARYVRRPTQNMPPYTAKVVSDQELADIYAFLLTIPQARSVSSIPQLAN